MSEIDSVKFLWKTHLEKQILKAKFNLILCNFVDYEYLILEELDKFRWETIIKVNHECINEL